MENRNFSNDITLHSTIMQCQFRKSTLLPLSFSNAITSQLDSRKRYFHLPSKRHYHRSIVEIRAKLHLASPYQKLDVYRLFLVTVEFRWMDRIAERDPFSRGIRIDSPPFKMDTSPPHPPSGGGKNSTDLLKRSEISVESFEIPFRECDFLVLSWNMYHLPFEFKWTGRTNWAWGQRFLNLY